MRTIFIFLCIFFVASVTDALRVPRPFTFSLPWTEDQITKLNNSMADLWNITNGKYNLDVVTTPKTDAKNGDMWILFVSPIAKLQYRANNTIFTITPD